MEQITPEIQQIIDWLCPCIENKNYIQFYYSDENTGKRHYEGVRQVEPHLLGVNKKGNIVLVAFAWATDEQIADGKKSADWGLFLLRNMSDLLTSKTKFIHTRPYYNPNDERMVQIICRTQVS